MSIFQRGLSAVGKLIALGLLVAGFFVGMIAVVLMSLQGAEIKVPEITGKTFVESEHELASLGLKIKKRADRSSDAPPNTVIEQLPKPGETVKTGQWILVVTSKGRAEGEEPLQLIKKDDQDDSSKIEEMISDKPKKPKANSNTNRKKADTTRDVIGDNSNSDGNSNSNSSDSNSNKKETLPGSNTTKNNTKNPGTPTSKPAANNSSKPVDGRPRLANRP